MADYQEYRRRILHRRWRRMFITAALLILLVLLAAVGVLWKRLHREPAPNTAQGPTILQQELTGSEWNTISYTPARRLSVQTLDNGMTAMDFRLAAQPASPAVERSSFSDVSFLGDSLTQGMQLYDTGLPNAHFCAYKGVGPNAVVNNTTCRRADGEKEVPMEALASQQPRALYILLGTNVLTADSDYTSFLTYYRLMLDMISQALPNTKIYVQSITPVRPEVSKKSPGLYDAKCLLEQTEGKGINVYTHSEMLPAHGYPELKKRFPHLKGNFGTAWQNQQREFEDIPAPVLFTTNCIMPLRPSYADRVFTTSVVSYPGVTHIGEDRDFSPVIAKALELGGYPEDTLIPGMNGGSVVTTGFAHHAVLSHAEEIVQAVHEGAIRHFFLIGGCDGTRPSRRYYTDFAKLTPSDTVILTLACGKFRLNDLPLGTVAGLPRILDVGQCNDAYSAIRIALGLAEAFDCSVNELPLSIILCWFEQKAVCVLMALLALGIRGIRLGPTLPAFLSPGVAAVLQEKYDLRPITTPEDDLAACLGRH